MHFLVAFINREESRETLDLAVRLAVPAQAYLTILKVVANPHSVGVIAELIATDEPLVLSTAEVQSVVDALIKDDIDARAEVRMVEDVAKGIVQIVEELGADLVFLGTRDVSHPTSFLMQNDPIAHYVVEHCPAHVVLVRERRV